MKKVSYMPGCAVKTTGKNFENSAIQLLQLFDVEAVELEEWYCCGTTYSLASDNLMQHLAPVRNLVKALESGNTDLLILCSMCYNTISRARELILHDREKRDKINDFMYKENESVAGTEVNLVHFLTLLKDHIGFEAIREKITPIETVLKAAAYYGCMLVRPKEVSIDPCPDDPTIMEDTLSLFGVEPVYFPFKTECCGSYQVINKAEVVLSRTEEIAGSARKNGAETIVTSCPLCCYNLDYYQKKIAEDDPSQQPLPVFYIAELLALMAGLENSNDYSLHHVDPTPLLAEKGIIAGVKT